MIDQEREAYDNHLKWLMIEANTLKKYEAKGRKEGRAEGREEGRAEGREEGRAEGREEGREEERIAVVVKMIEKGHNDEMIRSVTGITAAQLAKLRAK